MPYIPTDAHLPKRDSSKFHEWEICPNPQPRTFHITTTIDNASIDNANVSATIRTSHHLSTHHAIEYTVRQATQPQWASIPVPTNAESGTNKSNKKQKAATKETTEDDNNESQVTGKGKGTAKGRKKGTKCPRYIAQLTTPSPIHFF